MKNLVIIFVYILFVSLVVLLVKNRSTAINKIMKIQEKKIFKPLKIIIIVMIIAAFFIYLYNSIKKIKNSIELLNETVSQNQMFEACDNIIKEENKLYKEMIKKVQLSATNPYIPEEFEYVEGDIDTGYVIQDEKDNQFVWVPCSRENLKKKNFDSKARILYNYCFDENYKEFIESALMYGGFYISRFEIGKENNIPVSKSGVNVWTDINKLEANQIISQMYANGNLKCELINGYAYDTTLQWLLENNDFKIDIVNVAPENEYQKANIIYDNQSINFVFDENELEKEESKSENVEYNILCGRNKINNIYDFCDNIFELTQEKVYDVNVSRGYLKDNVTEMYSRFTILDCETNFLEGQTKLAMRVILYK